MGHILIVHIQMRFKCEWGQVLQIYRYMMWGLRLMVVDMVAIGEVMEVEAMWGRREAVICVG